MESILDFSSGTVVADYSNYGMKVGYSSTSYMPDAASYHWHPSREKVKSIGKYVLPDEVIIELTGEDDVYCAECLELLITSCSENFESAVDGLETELQEAIELYVVHFRPEDLDTEAVKYRKILEDIKRLNSS